MDRSFAGRPGSGRLVPPRASAARRSTRRATGARGRSPRRTGGSALSAPFFNAARVAQLGASLIWRRRRLRIAVVAVIAASPLLAGGYIWLRGSSLLAVSHVRVVGAHGADARAIDAALTSAARRMTTLDVRPAALRAAVAAFPTVRDVRVSTSFPHAMRIDVIEQPPVAALTLGATRTAVAADGVILGPALLSSSLPSLAAAGQRLDAKRVSSAGLLGALSVLGAAPPPLAKLIERTYIGPRGVTVAMHGGLLIYFGDAGRPHAKWISLSRVLADTSSAGASYIDVRLPERPAAGFAPGRAPTAASSSSASSPSSASTTEALAAGLSAAAGGGSSSTPAETAETHATSTSEGSSSGGGEAGPEVAPEASSAAPAAGG